MSQPILFLDIDGVLNSTRWAIHLLMTKPNKGLVGEDGIDPCALSLLQVLVEELNLRVVVSSSWRIIYSTEELADLLGIPICGATDRLPSPARRGDEIKAWLAENGEADTAYVIVDDDSDVLPEQQDRFVQTKHEDGLLWTDFMAIRAKFGVTDFPSVSKRQETEGEGYVASV